MRFRPKTSHQSLPSSNRTTAEFAMQSFCWPWAEFYGWFQAGSPDNKCSILVWHEFLSEFGRQIWLYSNRTWNCPKPRWTCATDQTDSRFANFQELHLGFRSWSSSSARLWTVSMSKEDSRPAKNLKVTEPPSWNRIFLIWRCTSWSPEPRAL